MPIPLMAKAGNDTHWPIPYGSSTLAPTVLAATIDIIAIADKHPSG
jgi:hypothetical protein